jgi:hypothetical protein
MARIQSVITTCNSHSVSNCIYSPSNLSTLFMAFHQSAPTYVNDLDFERLFLAVEHRHLNLAPDLATFTENLEACAYVMLWRQQCVGAFQLFGRMNLASGAMREYQRTRMDMWRRAEAVAADGEQIALIKWEDVKLISFEQEICRLRLCLRGDCARRWRIASILGYYVRALEKCQMRGMPYLLFHQWVCIDNNSTIGDSCHVARVIMRRLTTMHFTHPHSLTCLSTNILLLRQCCVGTTDFLKGVR